jgi:hypothetical protein
VINKIHKTDVIKEECLLEVKVLDIIGVLITQIKKEQSEQLE